MIIIHVGCHVLIHFNSMITVSTLIFTDILKGNRVVTHSYGLALHDRSKSMMKPIPWLHLLLWSQHCGAYIIRD